MNSLKSLGRRLRAARKQRRLTLVEVSAATGLSVGFLSQVERDITRPSLDSLGLIVRALDATLSAMLHQPDLPVAASRSDGRVAHFVQGGPARYEQLSTTFPSQMLNAVKLHVPPGLASPEFSYEGEQLVIVLSGSVRFIVDQVMFELNSGDSLHFSTIRPHRMINPGEAGAELVVVSTRQLLDDQHMIATSITGRNPPP